MLEQTDANIITRTAPAKLNLALAVGPPEASGMHPICSWMVTINLCDELTLKRLPADRLSRYAVLWHEDAKQRTEIDWPIRSDLAVRAHLALEQHLGRPLPVQLKLDKRIPVGGGLGGGSSDAATTLNALNDLFELELSREQLIEIASTLGSDVAFFIDGGSAIVEGFGEQVTATPRSPEIHAALIFPPLQCGTAEVYRTFDTQKPNGLKHDAVHSLASEFEQLAAGEGLINDLAEPAMTAVPALREHYEAVSRLAERPAAVAGSGSSLFVICDDALHAEALAGSIEAELALPAVAVENEIGEG